MKRQILISSVVDSAIYLFGGVMIAVISMLCGFAFNDLSNADHIGVESEQHPENVQPAVSQGKSTSGEYSWCAGYYTTSQGHEAIRYFCRDSVTGTAYVQNNNTLNMEDEK